MLDFVYAGQANNCGKKAMCPTDGRVRLPPKCCMHDKKTFSGNAMCMTIGGLLPDLMYAWQALHLAGNAVDTTGSSVRHPNAVWITAEHLLGMLCA